MGVTQERNHGLKVEGGGTPKFCFRPTEGKQREGAQIIIGAPNFFSLYPIIILIVVTNKNTLVLEAIQIF